MCLGQCCMDPVDNHIYIYVYSFVTVGIPLRVYRSVLESCWHLRLGITTNVTASMNRHHGDQSAALSYSINPRDSFADTDALYPQIYRSHSICLHAMQLKYAQSQKYITTGCDVFLIEFIEESLCGDISCTA